MKADGFRHASTIHSELFALNNGRAHWSAKTVVIVDEAAMIDTKLMAMVTASAHDSRAKLILVGDDRQLSSIDRGGMFGALKDRYGAAALSEVKRQYKHDERRASEMMAEGNFHDALNIYDAKGAIHWTRTQGEARAQLIEQWAMDSAAQPDKTRFVLAYTNEDVDRLNLALRDIRKTRGALGDELTLDTAHGRFNFSIGDRIQFTGTDKKQGITNGRAGTVEAIDGSHIAVKLDGRHGKTIAFDAASFDQFRHGYAVTIHKSQGSEYPAVVIPVLTQHYVMLQRNLLYTGVTRGKRLVVLVGQKKAVAIAVHNASGRRRWSKLNEWLAISSMPRGL